MTIDWRILVGLTLAAVIAFAVLLVIDANLRADLSSARSESAALHIDNAGFKDKVEKQNATILAYQKQGEQRVARATKVAKVAKKQADTHFANAAALEKKSYTGESCAAVDKLLNDYLNANAGR